MCCCNQQSMRQVRSSTSWMDLAHECIVNFIDLEGQRSSALIKGVAFGVLQPGDSVRKTLRLTSTGAGGERVLDISVQSRVPHPDGEDAVSPDSPRERIVEAVRVSSCGQPYSRYCSYFQLGPHSHVHVHGDANVFPVARVLDVPAGPPTRLDA